MPDDIAEPAGEPIAIVGRSCRFPGGQNPEDYWELLRDGRSAVRELPASRLRPAGRGGFLDGIDEFDPGFFRISLGEAAAMDPQQRLMLELSWEALEDASIVPAALRGTATGVFVGAMSGDYATLVRDQDVSRHTFTGLARSLIPNRVSYLFGLRGASLTVDAGQASSLVAVHLACQSLRSGESRLALAGGVELSFARQSAIIADRLGAMSPDGECFTFDARANGYVPGEGGAVVVLKTLARALADGDRVRAVILGSAANNDGGGTGLTAPHEAAQREVLRLACQRADVSPADVQYVELHGTGTSVGDPVEAAALGAVFGSARPHGQVLRVGSAKTNVGHLGAAAGMAGLLKVVLAIEHDQLPPSLNFATPNPEIPLADLNLAVQDTLGERGPTMAGVSAFSIGGTNCHVVITAPVAARRRTAQARECSFRADVIPLAVSGRTAEALRAQAGRLRAHVLANPQYSLPDLGLSLALSRTAFRHRAVMLVSTREELCAELAALEAGTQTAAQVTGVAEQRSRAVFVFPGTAAPWPGAAASLLDSSAAFRAAIRAYDEVVAADLGWAVEHLLSGVPGAPRLDRPDVARTVLFAVQAGLASLWRSFGVEPAAVVGEGAGMAAAAYVAGAMPLAAAARVAAAGTGARRPVSSAGSRIPIRSCGSGLGQAIASLADHDVFVEIGPRPVLAAAVGQAVQDAGSGAIVVEPPAGDDVPRALLGSLAAFHVAARAVNWRPAFGPDARVVSLPTYPFQRRRCWLGDPDMPDGAGRDERDLSRLNAGEILAVVCAEAAAMLADDAGESPDPACSFSDLGFDSITAIELSERLAARTGMTVPATDLFDYPSPAALASHLHARVSASAGRPPNARAPVPGALAVRTVPARAAAASRAAPPEDAAAVVATACRYPGGADSAEKLWRLAMKGKETISGFPVNRGWDLRALSGLHGRPGRSAVSQGGFLYDADRFDAAFFGIGPREATAMDPQQRLLLELAWEAIERAGIQPASLRDTRCGVFVGAMPQEYGPRMHEAPAKLSGYLLTGNSTSVLSGRLAYTFGLEGPAVTVDTACSSSLVALHLAMTALSRGECSLALVAGVTVMSSPGMFTEFSRQHGLAPDGRCKPFAAAADGTAWSEGAAVLVIERLADARRNHHEVLALIRSSAINQDGASNGLTAPSGPSQEQVIRQALASAGLTSADVDAVEAHGTGTPLGDPIEARAVLATYGQDRPHDRPLLLGSVKSHIGHTQAAAGMAGVITMIQSIRHGVLPATMHVGEPSPHVDWTAGAVSLLTGNTRWPDTGRARRAGVSSFGISGTNAHVIIEEAPETVPRPAATAPPSVPVPWPVTARDDTALRALAGRLRAHVAAGRRDAASLSFSLATTRATFEHRAVTVAADADGHLNALRALAVGQASPELVTGVCGRHGPLAVMLTGQGSQHPGMGRELYATYSAFADALDEVCAAIGAFTDLPLRDIMFAGPGTVEAGQLRATSCTQPALFALQVALYRLISSFGIRADYLIGHSIGELTAAHLAGVLSLPDAAALVTARGAMMQALPETGAMVALQAAEDEIVPLLDGLEQDVSIAAVNGPASVVISGTAHVVDGIAHRWREAGRQAARLRVSHAFHSPHMDAVLEDFREVAARLSYSEPAIPVVSNVTGRVATPGELASPDYWTRHIRQAVRFHDGIRHLDDLGVTRFLEVGPDTVLARLARACLAVRATPPPVIASTLAAGRSEPVTVLTGLAQLYVSGTDVDWRGCFAGQDMRPVPLPVYPFRRKRYWIDPAPGRSEHAAAGLRSDGHPLLSAGVDAADGSGAVLTGSVSARSHPWLGDHVVLGEVLFPATAFLELALHAARRTTSDPATGPAGPTRVDELALESPLALSRRGAVQLQLLTGAEGEAGRISIYARPADESRPWSRHASGVIRAAEGAAARPAPAGSWPPDGAEPIDITDIYDRLATLGYRYGPAFRGLRAAWRSGADVLAEVALTPEQQTAAGRYCLHPALLDAALHAVVGLFFPVPEADMVRVPFSWAGTVLHATGADSLRVRVSPAGPDAVAMTLTDLAGLPVASVDRLTLRPVPARSADAASDEATPSGRRRRASRDRDHGGLFVVGWQERAPVNAAPRSVAVVGTVDSVAAQALRARNGHMPCYQDVGCLRRALDDGASVPVVVAAAVDSEDHGDLAGRTSRVCGKALDLARYWITDARLRGSRLVFVTTRAFRVAGCDIPDPAGSALWGLIRSASTEHPGRFGLVDIDDHPASAGALLAALAGNEPQLAIRAGNLSVPRLRRAPTMVAAPLPSGPLGGHVLITGGTGALGRLLARHLVTRHGVRRLLLVSRQGQRAPGAGRLAAELAASGAEVAFAACDIASRAAATDLLARIPAQHPLTGIVHAAGVLDDCVVADLDAARLERVLLPKVAGALNLHELTAGTGLSGFVLFSSVAGTLGTAGQAAYAAANAFLDGLAGARHAAGLPALSLAWGLWSARGGMAGRLAAADLRRLARSGIRELAAADALELFDAAVGSTAPVLTAARLDPAGVSEDISPPLLQQLAGPDRLRVGGELLHQLSAAPPSRRQHILLDAVRAAAATVLGHSSPTAVAKDVRFQDLGVDSLAAIELRNRLSSATGLGLPTTLLFEHPTPGEVAERLHIELFHEQEKSSATHTDPLDTMETEDLVRRALQESAT